VRASGTHLIAQLHGDVLFVRAVRPGPEQPLLIYLQAVRYQVRRSARPLPTVVAARAPSPNASEVGECRRFRRRAPRGAPTAR
jgi:hypothetical protein